MPFGSTQRVALPVTTNTTNIPDGIQTGNALRIDEYDPIFHQLNDGSALFYRLLSMTRKGPSVSQPRYNWFEDDIMENTTTASAGYNSSATVIGLTHGNLAAPNSKVININTGEHILVTSADNTGITACQRGAFGTTAVAITSGDVMVVLGPMLPEGGVPQKGRTSIPAEHFNWVAFYSKTAKESDIQGFTNMLNDVGHLNDQIKKNMILQMRDMDSDLRYSKKGITVDTSATSEDTGKRVYSFAGLEAQVDNSETFPAGVTYLDLCSILNPYFRQTGSSGVKTLLVGPGLYAHLMKVAWDRFVEPPQFESTLGAQFAKISLSEGGQVEVINDVHGMSASYGKQNSGYLLDMAYIQHREFNGMGLQVRDVTDPSGHHIQKREIFASQSLQVIHSDSLHAMVTMEEG